VPAPAHAVGHGGRLDELWAVADDGYDAHGSNGLGLMLGMARGMTSAARAAYAVGTSAARHAVWYVRYQVDGTARARRQPPRPKRTSGS
jgi:hypothetical protein